MKKIYLVDMSSLFFRAFYAVRPLSSPSGVPVNAIYGLLSMIVKLFKSERPDYIVFCYDRKEPSFRKEIYADYKANRSEMPEELATQIPYMKKLVDLLGIPSLEVAQFEADDLIGTLTRLAINNKMEAVIISGDKDFAQLIQPGVIMYDTMKESKIDSKGVVEKWGVHPEQFCDYLAIVGDSSDNIPGVEGLGPKGAQKLLSEYKNLHLIYENLEQVKPAGAQEKLRKSKEMAFLSLKLVKIDQYAPVDENMENYRLKGMKRDELKVFLQELNFKTFEKSLLGEPNASYSIPASPMVDPVQKVESSTSSSIQVQTLPLPEFLNAVSGEKKIWAWSQPQGIFYSNEKTIWRVEGDLKQTQVELEKLGIEWLGFDLKSFWREAGGSNPKIHWDSMLAAYVVRAGDCSDFYKVIKIHCENDLPELAGPEDFLRAHLQLKAFLEKKIHESQNRPIYEELDLPLAPILLRMETRGIKIDVAFLKKFSEELARDMMREEKEIFNLAGESFNVGSPKQLAHILFEKLKLPAAKKTKTGYSTDNEVLQELDHPIGKCIVEYRELAKLKSTYVDALPELADPKDHRVHTHFNQALTTTGRLSSTQPNLQNIPIRTERGARVREAFIAEQGYQLLNVDYSQIELRILAHISEDPNLIRAFNEDLDIHTATASEVFGVKLSEVTSDQRRKAKAVNFGIAYGQGAFGLAETLGISRGEAKEIIDRYFARFKGIRTYIDETIKSAYDKGYVETLFGRRRYLDELQSKSPMIKKFGERAAINAPIQGTAADLVKKAMIQVDQECPIPLLLQVHDELVFEAKPDQLEEWTPTIVRIMENVVKMRVPLKVNTK